MDKKIYYIICIICSYGITFILFRYAIIVLLPFVIAYVFAWMIKPVVNFLHNRLKFNEKIAVAGSILVISSGLVYGAVYIMKQLLRQCISLLTVLSSGKSGMEEGVKNICGCIEAFAEAGDGIIGRVVWKYVGKIDLHQVVNSVVNGSLYKAVGIGKAAFVIAVAMFASYYFLTGKDSINRKIEKCILADEIRRIKVRIYTMGVGYIKAQVILFFIIAIVCYGGYTFAGTGYPLLLAVVSAALDALPMIGVSVIMVPLIAYFLVKYEFISVLVLMICLVLCYCIREIMEPRIMGKRAGLSPLCAMVSIYVGYELFGISGLITGPFAYIVADEIKKILIEFGKVRLKCHKDSEI